MLRAFALYVALMVSVIVALICGSLLTLYYLNDKEYYIYETKARLRSNVASAFNYAREHELKAGSTTLDLFALARDSVTFDVRSWGLFQLLSVKAFSGGLSKNKSAFVGALMGHTQDYALYMANSNKALSLCGKTSIVGTAFVPEAGVERAYIEGQNFMGDRLIEGEQKFATALLPALKKESIANTLRYLNGEAMEGDTLLAFHTDSVKVIRSFGESALVLQSTAPIILQEIMLKGKIVVRSSQWVQIKKSAQLENILVFAPFIFIDDEFEGAGQFYASDSLVVGENCKFNYPSALALVNNSTQEKSTLLKIGKGSKIQGAVFSYQERQSIRSKNLVVLAEGSKVLGQVYSNGYLELHGVVYGTVLCQQFLLKTSSSVYENHLLNTTIDRSLLPEDFVGLYLFELEQKRAVAKWLN